MNKIVVGVCWASVVLFTHSAFAQTAPEFTMVQKVEAILQELQAEDAVVNDDTKKMIEGQLSEQAALANVARQQGFDKTQQVKVLAEIGKEQALVSVYLQNKLASFQPTDEQLRRLYDEQINQSKEYHLRHILVNDETLAKQLITQIQAGKSFQALAKKHSKDTFSGKKGGDLDWMPLDAWVPEFKVAAGQLQQVNQITQIPVQTQFGFHIIQLAAAPRVSKNIPEFEAVKPKILELAKAEYRKELIQQAVSASQSK